MRSKMSGSPGEESLQPTHQPDLKLLVHRVHSLNSECESGYDETPSECDIKEVVGLDDDDDEEEILVVQTETDVFTDEGRESVETGGVEELEEDTLVSTEDITSRNAFLF